MLRVMLARAGIQLGTGASLPVLFDTVGEGRPRPCHLTTPAAPHPRMMQCCRSKLPASPPSARADHRRLLHPTMAPPVGARSAASHASWRLCLLQRQRRRRCAARWWLTRTPLWRCWRGCGTMCATPSGCVAAPAAPRRLAVSQHSATGFWTGWCAGASAAVSFRCQDAGGPTWAAVLGQVRRLLQPTSSPPGQAHSTARAGATTAMAAHSPPVPFAGATTSGPSVLSVLMGVKSLQVTPAVAQPALGEPCVVLQLLQGTAELD